MSLSGRSMKLPLRFFTFGCTEKYLLSREASDEFYLSH